jgi:hypothetical protein
LVIPAGHRRLNLIGMVAGVGGDSRLNLIGIAGGVDAAARRFITICRGFRPAVAKSLLSGSLAAPQT